MRKKIVSLSNRYGVDDLFLIRTVDNGKSFTSSNVGSQIDALTDTGLPLGLSFADATHGWLAGSNHNEQGIILRITDVNDFRPAP